MRQYHMPIQDRETSTETLKLNFGTSFKTCWTSTKKQHSKNPQLTPKNRVIHLHV